MFRTIIASYLNVWPFALAHGALLLLVIYEGIKLRRDAALLSRAAQNGSPDSLTPFFGVTPRAQGNDLIQSLSLLVEDRLDRFNSHTNLFLLVGIAGTFYGMFQLALVQSGPGGSANATQLQDLLRRSLNHALPVGFVGTGLAFGGHLLSSWLGKGVREAVARIAATREPDSQEHQVRALTQVLAEAVDALKTSLTPLAGVDAALAKALQPLTETMILQLDKNERALATHFGAVESALGSFGGLLEGLRRPVEQLAAAGVDVEQAHKRMLERAELTEKLVLERADALRVLQDQLGQTANRMHTATDQLGAFPGQLRLQMEGAFTAMAEGWKTTIDRYSNSLASEMIARTSTLSGAVEHAGRTMVGAAEKLDAFSTNAGARLTEGVRDASEQIAKPLRDFEASIRREMPESITRASQILDSGLARVENLHQGIHGLGALTVSVRQALDAWAASRDALVSVSRELQESASVLSGATQTVADLERSYITVRWPRKRRRPRA